MTYKIIGKWKDNRLALFDQPLAAAESCLEVDDVIEYVNGAGEMVYGKMIDIGTKLQMYFVTAAVKRQLDQMAGMGVITTYDFAEDYRRGMG